MLYEQLIDNDLRLYGIVIQIMLYTERSDHRKHDCALSTSLGSVLIFRALLLGI